MAEPIRYPLRQSACRSSLVVDSAGRFIFDCKSGRRDAAGETAASIVEACNNYARLREENAALVEALAEYVILGAGKCTIGKPAVEKALAALSKSREGNGGNNG